MPFADDLVFRGTEGGEKAALLLREAVEEYWKKFEMYRPGDKIIIRVYANLRGLSRTYTAAKIMPADVSYLNFVSGFTHIHPLTDFVHAGNQKEAADAKLKGMPTANPFDSKIDSISEYGLVLSQSPL